MWFLKKRPDKLTIRALITSLPNGYQGVNFRFNVQADVEKIWVAIPFPWAPHKENGGLRITTDDQLSLLDTGEFTQVAETDIEVYSRLRDLKTKDIELSLVQDLITWHLDDVAVMTLWITPGQTYQVSYVHKIASDSALFLPTRLPVFVAARRPEVDCKFWAANARAVDVPKHLVKAPCENVLKTDSLHCYTFPEDWGWDFDTRLGTYNWDSSDDEDLESDDDAAETETC